MPEGPELFMSSLFINSVCRNRVFGRIMKSEINKNPHITPPGKEFTIDASARGKEIKLTLRSHENGRQSNQHLDVLFTFGLAGKFEFYPATELKKHAHMNFFTDDTGDEMVLSFNDYMRFGKWVPGSGFTYNARGPCVLYDYQAFRENVLTNLQRSVFDKPICEVLLNQKYFNGIGNYLRAEILYKARVPPFVSARSVLEPLAAEGGFKSDCPDLLQLCNLLPLEVVQLEGSWYDGQDRGDSGNAFNNWLQCYYQDGMKNIADHNKRTVWYSGTLGPLAPKDGKTRARKKSSSKKKDERKSQQDESISEVKIEQKDEGTNKQPTNRRKRKATEKDVKPKVNDDHGASRLTRSKVIKKEKKTEQKNEWTDEQPTNRRKRKATEKDVKPKANGDHGASKLTRSKVIQKEKSIMESSGKPRKETGTSVKVK